MFLIANNKMFFEIYFDKDWFDLFFIKDNECCWFIMWVTLFKLGFKFQWRNK